MEEEIQKEEVLEILPTGSFLDKSEMTTLENYKILSVDKHIFKDNLKTLSIQNENREGRINLNATTQNFLIEKLGAKPKEWIGKEIKIVAVAYKSDAEDISDGYTLKFHI